MMEYMESKMQDYIENGISEADSCYARIAELELQVDTLQQFCLTVQEVKELEAVAGRAGFIACYTVNKIVPVNDESVQILADGYADNIRQGDNK